MLRLFQLELPLFRRAAPPAEQARHIQLGTRIVDYRLIRLRIGHMGHAP